MRGGNNGDFLSGGLGNDVLDGGDGIDSIGYGNANSSSGVTISLAVSGPQNTGGAGIDTLVSIENVNGGNFADHLTGSDGDNFLFGGLGDDTLDGGAGRDIVSYNAAAIGVVAGVTVNLALTTAQNLGGWGSDTLLNFENIIGSPLDDHLTGTGGDNELSGANGNDTLVGAGGRDTLHGDAGNDTLDGGDGDDTLDGGPSGTALIDGGTGYDTVVFWSATSGVTASLAVSGSQNTGGAGTQDLQQHRKLPRQRARGSSHRRRGQRLPGRHRRQ